ncbi:MAG: EamA family transporter, partial [Gemmatimonadetes bacterium]|nr:EamA family transporter [Gemmatimonadota bacterium]
MHASAPRPALVYGALILVQVFFGFHYLAAKIALTEVTPQALALIRVTGGAATLLLIARLAGKRLPSSPRILGQLAALSIFGVVLNQVLFIEGLSRTTPTHSSLINTSIPALTLLFAVLAGRERPTVRRLGALAVAFVGVALVIRPAGDAAGGATLLGDLLTVGNALSFSFFLAASKPIMGRIEPFGATTVLMMFGAVVITALGWTELRAIDPAAVSPTTWALLAYAVIFPTAVSYLLQYWALAHVDS